MNDYWSYRYSNHWNNITLRTCSHNYQVKWCYRSVVVTNWVETLVQDVDWYPWYSWDPICVVGRESIYSRYVVPIFVVSHSQILPHFKNKSVGWAEVGFSKFEARTSKQSRIMRKRFSREKIPTMTLWKLVTDYQALKSQRGDALHKVQFLRGGRV